VLVAEAKQILKRIDSGNPPLRVLALDPAMPGQGAHGFRFYLSDADVHPDMNLLNWREFLEQIPTK